MKKEDIKNKYYDEFEISTKSREKITKGVIEDLKNIPASSIADMDDWRFRSMKKEKKYLDVVKKVGIASVSLIATGAIIFGVAKYNDGNKHTKNGKNNTTEEYSSEELTTEWNYSVDKEDKYVKVFENISEKTNEKGSLKTALGQAECGDYIFEIEGSNMDDPSVWSQTCMWISIKGKNDDKFKEIKDLKFSSKDDVYTDGEYIITEYDNSIYKYDIVNDKMKSVGFDRIEKITEGMSIDYGQYTGIKEVITVKEDIVYVLVRREREKPLENFGMVGFDVISYNLNTDEFNLEIDNYYDSYVDNGNYMVAQSKMNDGINVLSLYSFKPDGLLGEKDIKENIEFQGGCDDKVYYTGNEVNIKVTEDTDFPIKLTLYSYDVADDKETELAVIDIKDFTKDAEFINYLENVSDEWCKVVVDNKNGEILSYKYTYATKKIEEMDDDESDI